MPALKIEGLTLERLANQKLGEHADVDLTGLLDADTISYELSSDTWKRVAGLPPAAHTFGSHSDVVLTAPVSGDVVQFDGANWVNVVADAPAAHAATHMLGGSDPVTSFDNLTADLNLGGNNIVNAASITLSANVNTPNTATGSVFARNNANTVYLPMIGIDSGDNLNIGRTDSIGATQFFGTQIWFDDVATPLERARLTTTGAFTAVSFGGIGTALTALNAGNIATGTLAEARGGTGLDTSGVGQGGLLRGAPGGAAWQILALGASGRVLTSDGTSAEWSPSNAHTHPASDITTGTFGPGDFTFQANLNIGGNFIASAAIPVTFRGTDTTNESGLLLKGRAANAGGAITAAGILLRLQGFGHDGVGYQLGGEIEFESVAVWNGTNHDTQINFKTTSSGSAPITRLSITATGTVAIVGSSTFGGNAGGMSMTGTVGTSETSLRFNNTNSRLFVGIDSTVGNRFVNSSANAAFLGTTLSVPLEFATNNIIVARFSAAGDFQILNDLTVQAAGPHAIGGSVNASRQLHLKGSFAGPIGLSVEPTLTPGLNNSAFLLQIIGTLVEHTTGAHPDFVSLEVQRPTITAGAASLTNATSLKILNAPTAGVNNRALWVASGETLLQGLTASDLDLTGAAFSLGDTLVMIDATGVAGIAGTEGQVLTYLSGSSQFAAANLHTHSAADITPGVFQSGGGYTFNTAVTFAAGIVISATALAIDASAAVQMTWRGTDTTNEAGLIIEGRTALTGGAISAAGILLRLQGLGHDGTGYAVGGEIEFESVSAWDISNHDTQINFKTASTGAAPITRWSIANNGTLIPANSTTSIGTTASRMGTIFATTVDGMTLIGNGASVTNLDAANIATNNVPAARLSMTTNGDLITRSAGTTGRVGLGSIGQVLTVFDANGFSWAAPAPPAAHGINSATHTGFPLTVLNGGTGRTSLTDEGILVGQGTATPSSLALTQGALVTSTSINPPFVVAILARGTDNQFLRMNGNNLSWEALVAADIPAHDLTSAHSESGLTVGHFLKALTATTFGFADHGLTFTDVDALGATAQAVDSAALSGNNLAAVRNHAPQSHAYSVHTGTVPEGDIAAGPTNTILKTIVSTPTWSSLLVADIPNLPASKITSGAFADARIPNLNASKITAGVFAVARIPNINASKVIAGSFPTGTFTFTGTLVNFNGQAVSPLHVYAAQTGTFTPNWDNGNVQKVPVGATALTIAIEGAGNNMNEGGVYTLIVGGGAGTLSFSGVDWGDSGAPGSPGSTVAIIVGFVRSGNGFTLGFIIGEGYPDPT